VPLVIADRVCDHASFRSTIPPPANTLFGKVASTIWWRRCTNPRHGSGGLHAHLSKDGVYRRQLAPQAVVAPERNW
jgi:hypothetical protein